MDEYIYPNEHVHHQQHKGLSSVWQVPPLMELLKEKAKKFGLWYANI
jgi:acyl-CoA dehydrogenase